MSGEFNRASLDSDGAARNGSFSGPGSPATPTDIPAITESPVDNAPNGGVVRPKEPPKEVNDVMYSDIGITTLLNRLKQSIASARDFASFLQKRSKLEEEQATGLKRLASSHIDSLRKTEVRGGSYAAQVTEAMRVHERMADNGMQFALSLHQMHEDLSALSANMERGRKSAKHEGLDAEKRVSDAEAAMQKAKGRYDSLAEDYDRAKTGDTKGSRRIGLKGPKSQEQYEGDLQRKVQAADADYEEKVRLAKAQRESLVNQLRPKFVRQLQALCKECDAGLTLQLQKFATFNEKLLLGNGLAVSPLTGEKGGQRSLRDVIYDIDNESDFHNYIGGHSNKIPRPGEIKYEQHPTLQPKMQQPTARTFSSSAAAPAAPEPVRQPTLNVATPTSQPNSTSSRFSNQPPPGPLVAPSQSQAYGQPAYQNQPPPPSQAQEFGRSSTFGQQPSQPPYNPQQPPPRQEAFSNPPYPTHPDDRAAYAPQQQQTTGTIAPPPQQRNQFQSQQPPSAAPLSGGPISPAAPNLPPLRPTFGINLQELFDRDQSAVPLVVIQCILAVDHFGLETTGIYRQSGTQSHVTRLINQFNHNASAVDFRNPANFYHDVHIPATLLKQFFKQLPDPLFTHAAYGAFIDAARLEDEVQRRDGLHAIINDLPDPNYATLRALVLHLHRVTQHEGKNRMSSGNLAVCFAPSLMGTHTGSQIGDAGLQARVLDTILQNATAVFDED